LIEGIDVLEEVLPHLVDRLLQRLIPIRQRDHAHDLREVGVAGVAHEQPVQLARLLCVWPKPGARAVAVPEHSGNCGIVQATLLTTFAADGDLAQVSTRAPLIHPQLATAGGLPTVSKSVPVNVADVTLLAGPDETDRHDRAFAPIRVDELALGQCLA